MKQRWPVSRRLCIAIAGLLGWASTSLRAAGSARDTIARPAPSFDLRRPSHYFAAAATVDLVNAALKGDQAAAQAAVAAGGQVNDEGPRDKPNRIRPLHYAVAAENNAALALLMRLGADPELETGGFGPALLFAITLDNTPQLDAMLAVRPWPQLRPDTQETLVFRAVALGRPKSLSLLISRGAPVDMRDRAGFTPMMDALTAFDVPLARMLVEKHGASFAIEPTRGGATPANLVQELLGKATPGSAMQADLQALVERMKAQGIHLPVPTRQELRVKKPR